MKSKLLLGLWNKGNTKEKAAALFLAVIFTAIGLAIPSQVRLPAQFISESPAMSPRFFPYIVTIVGGLVSLIIFIRSYFQKPGKPEGGEGILGLRPVKRIAPAVMITIGYLLLFNILGYLLSAVLCFAALLWYYGVSFRREYAVAIPLIILLPLLTYILFKYELYVPLPDGILRGILPR